MIKQDIVVLVPGPNKKRGGILNKKLNAVGWFVEEKPAYYVNSVFRLYLAISLANRFSTTQQESWCT
jgi:hypothetical protein